MIEGSCHCGAVRFCYQLELESVTDCNCSICRRLHALWAYAPEDEVDLIAEDGATIAYSRGDRDIAFHTCATCGCTTHWSSLTEVRRMAVNMRLADPKMLEGIRVRRFDGADTWQELP